MMGINRAACGAFLALSPLLAIGCSGTGQRPVAAVKSPQAADQRLQMARQSERDGDLQKAEKLYLQLQQESPRNGEYAHRLGIIYTRNGAHLQAAEQFETALRASPQDARILSDAGYAEYLRGDLTAAARYLEQAMAQQKDNKRAVNNLALVYGHQGRFDESLALFRRFSPEPAALASLANIHRQRGEDDLALACFEEILELDPANAAASAAIASLAPRLPDVQTTAAVEKAPIQFIPDESSPSPAEEFVRADTQEPAVNELSFPTIPQEPQQETVFVEAPAAVEGPAVIAESMPAEEFEAPLPVTEAPTAVAAAPADDAFELPVIQPGNPDFAVQPEAAQVTIESGWQIESNEVQTRVLAPTAVPATAATTPDEDFFEVPEPVAAEVAATPETKLPTERVPTPAIPAATVLGMGGYCPVSLRNHREILEGAEAWEAEYNGVTYRFATPDALAEFHVDPESYIPVAGGLDVVAVREGRDVTSGSLEHATWFRDRLYLFASADTLAAFKNNARQFADGY